MELGNLKRAELYYLRQDNVNHDKTPRVLKALRVRFYQAIFTIKNYEIADSIASFCDSRFCSQIQRR